MGLAEIAKRAWTENVLLSALVELTYRCNLDCFFCYNDIGLQGKPLSTRQYFRFFEDLKDLQVLYLTFSGGEPLAHPDFVILGRKARDLGFVVRIKSNGHALRGGLARRIREEIDPFLIDVSLHGATAETHDRQTRVPGSFDRLLANLSELLEVGLRVKLNTTLTAWNEHEIEEMLAISDRLGVPHHIDPEVTPRDDGSREPLSIAPSREAVLRLFREQWRRAGERTGTSVEVGRQADSGLPAPGAGKHCGSGSSTIAVNPYGTVFPCVQWRWPLGNLHASSIGEIWSSSPILKEIRRRNVEAHEMVEGHGEDGKLLGFCPGVALLETGGPARAYSQAEERLGLHRQIRREAERALLPVIP